MGDGRRVQVAARVAAEGAAADATNATAVSDGAGVRRVQPHDALAAYPVALLAQIAMNARPSP